MNRRTVILCCLLSAGAALATVPKVQTADARLRHSFRRPESNGWTFVHLEGTPAEIGYQHGYLLSPEILDMKRVAELMLTHDTQKDWAFYRNAAREMMWPRIEAQYREELQGIADGLKARSASMDLWDVVALNGLLEWGYYAKEYDRRRGRTTDPASSVAPEHCSAFVATGSYTRDGRVIIAHNNWSDYLEGQRWTIIFDIAPAAGYRILMDGLPGLIASDDDFGINSAGIMITETTISGFEGYDPAGIPEFVRARKAMQHAASIDDFARIMREGNNGGYANDWLVADRKTNEIASLELGLKNVTLDRTKDGFFVGSNFPINPKLAREETTFDMSDMSNSANARHVRWNELMAEHKGKIDVALTQGFLGDHYDSYQKKEEPDERALCGHIDLSPRGSEPWQPPYGIAGAVQNKVADATMAENLSLSASAGHCCGIGFNAARHLKAHPEFGWQKALLRDMPSRPWTLFAAAK
jgi:hypothetical protein